MHSGCLPYCREANPITRTRNWKVRIRVRRIEIQNGKSIISIKLRLTARHEQIITRVLSAKTGGSPKPPVVVINLLVSHS